ncbi:MAG: hypothetical protein Q8873_00615 [Bacillota bacterium]|nr:hypothetical protein [Bacillota bacterium]
MGVLTEEEFLIAIGAKPDPNFNPEDLMQYKPTEEEKKKIAEYQKNINQYENTKEPPK